MNGKKREKQTKEMLFQTENARLVRICLRFDDI